MLFLLGGAEGLRDEVPRALRGVVEDAAACPGFTNGSGASVLRGGVAAR